MATRKKGYEPKTEQPKEAASEEILQKDRQGNRVCARDHRREDRLGAPRAYAFKKDPQAGKEGKRSDCRARRKNKLKKKLLGK